MYGWIQIIEIRHSIQNDFFCLTSRFKLNFTKFQAKKIKKFSLVLSSYIFHPSKQVSINQKSQQFRDSSKYKFKEYQYTIMRNKTNVVIDPWYDDHDLIQPNKSNVCYKSFFFIIFSRVLACNFLFYTFYTHHY